jgi:mitochondrial fission protein ELM1
MIIWALTDNRVGNNKQTLALAERLGKHKVVKVKYTVLAKLPSFGSNGFKLKEKGRPDLVIAAGRKLANVAWHLKKKHGCKVIQIMNPGKKLLKKFEHVIVPEHDQVVDSKNVIKITGAVCESKTYPATNNQTTHVAVLVGNIKAAEAAKLAEYINAYPATYQITTSRRTEEEAVYILEHQISQPHELYKYGSSAPNPYNDYIEKADIIMVTGDSVNMISEAAHTGKPLYILEVETKDKFKHLWQQLCARGIARMLAGQPLEKWNYTPLNNIEEVMQALATSA